MTDYITPDQAAAIGGDYYKGYYDGQEWAEFQAGMQSEGRDQRAWKLIRDNEKLKREVAKWMRLYLGAVKELAVNRALLEDAIADRNDLKELRVIVGELAATVPQGD